MTEDAQDRAPSAVQAAEDTPDGRAGLSATDRAAAFATGRAPVDRSTALRAGSTPVPRKFILWIAAGFAILGVGGLVAEHFVGSAGTGSPTTAPTTLAGTGGAPPPPPVPPDAPPINASLNAFIGLGRLTGHQAPAVALHDQTGAAWTLSQARGKVVVLTFFNSGCNDICSVLANEIAQARALLGGRSASVVFVVVNSDPLHTSLTPVPPALVQTGLINQANVVFLNGQLSDLNSIWRSYGVTVTVERTTHVVNHNDIMYFIGPTGKAELRATPFANEDHLGVYSLAPDGIRKFDQGVAASATSMLGQAR